jgi:DNA-binding response OmpR family regulator
MMIGVYWHTGCIQMFMSNTMKVVIIDDDQDDLEILQMTINHVHPEVDCATFFDSDSAMDAMMRDKVAAPDLVFIDINMPRMSGDECLKKLREQAKFNATKIVMISTSIPESFRKKLETYGADLIFTKPVDIKGYRTILSRCFNYDVLGKSTSN